MHSVSGAIEWKTHWITSRPLKPIGCCFDIGSYQYADIPEVSPVLNRTLRLRIGCETRYNLQDVSSSSLQKVSQRGRPTGGKGAFPPVCRFHGSAAWGFSRVCGFGILPLCHAPPHIILNKNLEGASARRSVPGGWHPGFYLVL